MTTTTTPLHTFISNVIGGSLMTQYARRASGESDVALAWAEFPALEAYQHLTDEVGLNFEEAASHVLLSVTNQLCEPAVSKHTIDFIAHMLWQRLGDPARNGDTPPPIYTEAGKAVHAWLVLCLHPTYITP